MTFFADDRRSGESDLGAEEGIFAYGRAVANLDEVVYLGAGPWTRGFADGGAVDAGVWPETSTLSSRMAGAGLADLVPATVGLAGEAEAVGPDHDSVLEDDVIA